MDNENIKEILDIIKKVSKAEVNSYNGLIETPPIKWSMFLDYITNLQEENQRLKEELLQEKKDFKEANDYCFELKDYKSRCEKSLKALHNSKEYKVMKELEFNKNMSILIKLDKLLGGDKK